MSLVERLGEIAARIPKMRQLLKTEEATKLHLILPFIKDVLGYNIFDPTEVSPEFVADIGTKKGEKVDYAVLSGGKPAMLIECKAVNANLDAEDPTQLYRYYTPTGVHLAVLTNGVNYRFYSDIEKSNVMDKEPFFEFSVEHLTEEIAAVVSKFVKGGFNLGAIQKAAEELKDAKRIKDNLADELNNPSNDFVRRLATRRHSGSKKRNMVKRVLDHFKELTRRAFQELIDERANEQLEKARQGGPPGTGVVRPPPPPSTYTEFWRPIQSKLGGLFTAKVYGGPRGSWISRNIRHINVVLVVLDDACRVELSCFTADRKERLHKALGLLPELTDNCSPADTPRRLSVHYPLLGKGLKDREDWDEIRKKLTSVGEHVCRVLEKSDV